MHVRAMNESGGPRYDLVINGTSTSLQNEGLQLDAGLFAENFVAYDMMYGPEKTPFVSWATAAGAARPWTGLGCWLSRRRSLLRCGEASDLRQSASLIRSVIHFSLQGIQALPAVVVADGEPEGYSELVC